MRGRTRTYSSHDFFVWSGSASKPPSSVQVDERAVPNSKPVAGDDVERRRPLGHADRMVHLRYAHHGAVAHADPRRLGGDRRQHDLGC
jgi:hypothetical protein